MKSKIVLFAFCLALLSGCGKKGFNMGGTPECAVRDIAAHHCQSEKLLSGHNQG